MEIGQRLKQARDYAKLTQEELAEKSGVKQGTISKIERGESDSSTFIVHLAVACGVRPEWLAMEQGEMVNKNHAPDQKIKAVLTAMENMPEYKKDILVNTSSALAESENTKQNGTQ